MWQYANVIICQLFGGGCFVLAFRYFNKIDTRTDQCDGDHLVPAETILADGEGDNGGNDQYNVAV